jgi:hypothetical protein
MTFADSDTIRRKFMAGLSTSAEHASTYLITYSVEQSPCWEANRFAASQSVNSPPPPFYGTRRFITALTNARQLSLSCASSIQPIPPHPPHATYLYYNQQLLLHPPSLSKLFICPVSRCFCLYSVPMDKAWDDEFCCIADFPEVVGRRLWEL